jgi:hypothetical protein
MEKYQCSKTEIISVALHFFKYKIQDDIGQVKYLGLSGYNPKPDKDAVNYSLYFKHRHFYTLKNQHWDIIK